ncbi:MAG: hypothetical protein ACR2IE_06215 [Candidatus Sumerlaeaceae bacterium]
MLVILMAVAVGAALWFRRRPMSTRQRAVVVSLAIGLLAFDFLGRGQADWGKVALVVAGSAVLVMAAVYLTRSQHGPRE